MKREGKVLVVEDNEKVVRAIDAAAEEHAFTCEHATDGWEAIEKLETGEYAAIVIDTDIPQHSGYGVLTYLREEVGDDKLENVIVMTSCDCEEVRRKVADNLKVVNTDDAVEAITRVMESE